MGQIVTMLCSLFPDIGGVQSCQTPFWCIMSHNPILIEPEELEPLLDDDKLLLVDLGKPESYSQIHVPGAIHLDYPLLLAGTKPAPGLLPPEERLTDLAGMLKLDPASRVVAYDDEGGGRAARLAWTLHYLGYQRVQVLNGGIHAWNNEGHPVSEDPVFPDDTRTLSVVSHDPTVLATRDYVLEHLNDDEVVLLDARTPEEYAGTKAYAARGGHIPGAKNINWQDTMDPDRNLRLKGASQLQDILTLRQIDPQQEVITYCQTHHRSAHAWMMLKSLGFTRVRGYAGSWSEWGNDPTLPVEQGGS